MNPTPPPPPPPPVPIKMHEPVVTSVSMMQQLDEGASPKVKFQKTRNNGTLKEIQESPLFGGGES